MPFGDAHAYVPLAVRGRAHARARVSGRCQPQGRLADAQQRARREADRAGAEAGAGQCRAVRGPEVGDRYTAVLLDGDRAVQPGHVRVVQRDVGVGGAADGDPAAVQEMDPARVRSRDHVQLGGHLVRLGVRLGLGGGTEGEHGAVDERGLAEGAALGVEALVARVQHDRAAALAAWAALGRGRNPVARDHRGEGRGDRGERRAGGSGDQYVAARGARPRFRGRPQRVYDGQPDLHRRQRSLLHGHPERRTKPRHGSHHRGLPPPHTST